MRIKLAPLANTIRGRQGGVVATKGRGTETIRRFTHPTNTQSTARTYARNSFANLQNIFSSLHDYTYLSVAHNPLIGSASPRNWFLANNLKTMKGEPDLQKLTLMLPFYPPITHTYSSVTGGSYEILFGWPRTVLPNGLTNPLCIYTVIRNLNFRTKPQPEDWDIHCIHTINDKVAVHVPVTYASTQYFWALHGRGTDSAGRHWYSVPVTGLATTWA